MYRVRTKNILLFLGGNAGTPLLNVEVHTSIYVFYEPLLVCV